MWFGPRGGPSWADPVAPWPFKPGLIATLQPEGMLDVADPPLAAAAAAMVQMRGGSSSSSSSSAAGSSGAAAAALAKQVACMLFQAIR